MINTDNKHIAATGEMPPLSVHPLISENYILPSIREAPSQKLRSIKCVGTDQSLDADPFD